MPKKYRLSHADFARLSKPARRVHGTYFSLSVIPAPLFGGPRAACVVSKKVSTRAVVRNRIERRCRESLRPALDKMEASLALIFVAKRESASASSEEIRRDVGALLGRIK